MKLLTPYIFISLFILFVNSSVAQDQKSELDAVYNMDPELYNGIISPFIYDRSVIGTQFLEENKFRQNNVGISDRIFEDQYINYDVYGQKLLLTFLNENGAQKMFEVPIENIQFFYIGDSYFEVLVDSKNEYIFYQVFTFEKSKILIHWSKNMKHNTGSTRYAYRFSTIQKQVWLLQDEDYHKIKNNKEFIQYLPTEQQVDAQNWFKSNKIKIQKANNESLQQISDYLSLEK